MDWTTEWPKPEHLEHYWFYGWVFRSEYDSPPELYYVKVARTRNAFCYITNGHFIYPEEGAIGFWKLPEYVETPVNIKLYKLLNKTKEE